MSATTAAPSYFDRRNACAACGGRSFSSSRLSNTGVVRTFTIVHRAARGVPAPYVSAVVDLDGGGRVKSNIINIEPTPQNVSLGNAGAARHLCDRCR